VDETLIYIGDVLFAIVSKGDPYQAKFVAAQLVRLKIASAEAVARAFGFAATSLRDWVAQLQRTGTLYPGDFKPGPVRPRKVTPEIFQYMATHPARSHADMAQQIRQRFDVDLNPHTVRLYRLRLQEAAESSGSAPETRWTQIEQFAAATAVASSDVVDGPSETARAPESAGTGLAPDSAVPAIAPDRLRSQPAARKGEAPIPLPPPDESVAGAGFLVLAPYLGRLGLAEWTEAHPWTQAHQFRPLTIVLAWVLAFVLGARSAEATKFGPREDWGWVIGAAHYPHPDTLRAITQEWTHDHLGPDLAAHCGPRYLDLFPEAPALIYLDGHFLPYSGHAAYAGRGYSTLKRLVIAGHEQFWVHDGQGHPLWVEEAAGDASFYQAIQQLSDRVRTWRTGRLLVVYDRGGVSEDTAAYLVAHDMDFLCYGKSRAVPKTAVWSEITLQRAGHERTYQVWEHTRRWGPLDTVRELWVQDGSQTFPVLTSHAQAAIGDLLIALWGRWKQENGFKLLVHDYGVNHFGDRDTTVLENRAMANPERTRLARRLATLDQHLGSLRRRFPPSAEEAAQGHALAGSAPKHAHTRWAKLQAALTEVTTAYEGAPETVSLWDLVPEERRQAFTFHNKAFQDACRIIAINGEHWLRQRVTALYPNPRHERVLMRWLLRARGSFRYRETTVWVELERPPRPNWARVIEELLAGLNAEDPRHPADPNVRIRFSLKASRTLKFSVKT
jgi:transposase